MKLTRPIQTAASQLIRPARQLQLMKLSFDGNSVTVGGRTWDAAHRVLDARIFQGRVLLILDYMEYCTWKVARNLEAYTLDGRRLWVAKHPTEEPTDAYTHFFREQADESVAIVNNFVSYICTIRVEDGTLVKSVFMK